MERRLSERLRGVEQVLEKTREKLEAQKQQQQAALADLTEARAQQAAQNAEIDRLTLQSRQFSAILGLAPPEKLRAVNRWQKALFLVRNPSLAQFSGKGHEPCDMKKLNKDLKVSSKEIKKKMAVAVVHPPPMMKFYPPPKGGKGAVAPTKVGLTVAP